MQHDSFVGNSKIIASVEKNYMQILQVLNQIMMEDQH